MQAEKLSMVLAAAAASAMLGILPAPQALARHHVYQAHHYHACGEFMFHRNGRCVDARSNSVGEWSQSMGRKSVW